MSANNWTICPRCTSVADKKRKQVEADLIESYGKISPVEYQKLQAIADRLSDDVAQESLREEYELSTNKDGTFSVEYYAMCVKCGFSFQHKHKEAIEL